jgi:hypothetical protein
MMASLWFKKSNALFTMLDGIANIAKAAIYLDSTLFKNVLKSRVTIDFTTPPFTLDIDMLSIVLATNNPLKRINRNASLDVAEGTTTLINCQRFDRKRRLTDPLSFLFDLLIFAYFEAVLLCIE